MEQTNTGLMYPHTLKFHKKVSQLDVKFIKPNKENVGCWMFQMAKALPGTEVKMDWENSILMKISLTDAMEIFAGMKNKAPVSLFHKNQRGTSTLGINPNEKGGFWINMGSNKEGAQSKYAVALQEKEMDLLLLIMKQSVAAVLGWV